VRRSPMVANKPVFVPANAEVLAGGVVVQAKGEMFKVSSFAAIFVVLAVLVKDQMLAQVEVRGVATMLMVHYTLDW